MLTVGEHAYCSQICRKRHQGLTRREQRSRWLQQRGRALCFGAPWILLGALISLLPLVILLLAHGAGQVRGVDLLSLFYLLPGGALLAVGIYHYRQRLNRRRYGFHSH